MCCRKDIHEPKESIMQYLFGWKIQAMFTTSVCVTINNVSFRRIHKVSQNLEFQKLPCAYLQKSCKYKTMHNLFEFFHSIV